MFVIVLSLRSWVTGSIALGKAELHDGGNMAEMADYFMACGMHTHAHVHTHSRTHTHH